MNEKALSIANNREISLQITFSVLQKNVENEIQIKLYFSNIDPIHHFFNYYTKLIR